VATEATTPETGATGVAIPRARAPRGVLRRRSGTGEPGSRPAGAGGGRPEPLFRPPSSRWRQALSRADGRYSPYLFIAPFFLLFAVFGLYPLGRTLWVSLHDWSVLGTHSWVGLDNYTTLISDERFWNAVRNTLGMFLLATIPQLMLALVLAQALNRRLRARTALRLGILIPNVTSVAAVGIIFTLIFARDFGLANWLLDLVGIDPIHWQSGRLSSWTAISVMVDWRWTGYNALILLAAMQAIPRDLYEAAEIDGAGQWKQFFAITIPMLRPTLLFVVIVSTIGGIQLFTEPLLFNAGAGALAGGTQRQFQTVAMYLVEEAFPGQDFGYAAAISWVLLLLIAAISAVNVWLISRIRSAD
jgi:cellobiose transport system permease protein